MPLQPDKARLIVDHERDLRDLPIVSEGNNGEEVMLSARANINPTLWSFQEVL